MAGNSVVNLVQFRGILRLSLAQMYFSLFSGCRRGTCSPAAKLKGLPRVRHRHQTLLWASRTLPRKTADPDVLALRLADTTHQAGSSAFQGRLPKATQPWRGGAAGCRKRRGRAVLAQVTPAHRIDLPTLPCLHSTVGSYSSVRLWTGLIVDESRPALVLVPEQIADAPPYLENLQPRDVSQQHKV